MISSPETLDAGHRPDSGLNILFAVTKALPLIESGGLADVAGRTLGSRRARVLR